MGEEGVIAIIFAGEVFYIFGKSSEPRAIPWDSVTEMMFFDDD